MRVADKKLLVTAFKGMFLIALTCAVCRFTKGASAGIIALFAIACSLEYDVIVNAILWDKMRKDHIICRSDLQRMKRGAMIVDISCDRAGAIETSVPTTIAEPTYFVDGIRHYVVDHTPALFYKSTSRAISEVLPKYLNKLIAGDELADCQIVKIGVIKDRRIIDFQKRT